MATTVVACLYYLYHDLHLHTRVDGSAHQGVPVGTDGKWFQSEQIAKAPLENANLPAGGDDDGRYTTLSGGTICMSSSPVSPSSSMTKLCRRLVTLILSDAIVRSALRCDRKIRQLFVVFARLGQFECCKIIAGQSGIEEHLDDFRYRIYGFTNNILEIFVTASRASVALLRGRVQGRSGRFLASSFSTS